MIGQKKIADEFTVRAYTIEVDDFSYIPTEGPQMCGEILADGCFFSNLQKGPTIAYNVRVPSVIRHEVGHGILFLLGFKDFNCYEHGCPE